MPIKERHFVISLEDVGAAAGKTEEADLSSANWAFVYAKTPSGGNTSLKVEACPLSFDQTAAESDWYTYGSPVTLSASTDFCMAIPFQGFWDYVTPQRVRINVTTALGLTDIFIEGIREIA